MQVSVVIPARDEEDSIGALLEALSHQTRVPQEVVVVDAGSIDRTSDIVQRYAKGSSFPIKLIKAGESFPGRARNIGIRECASSVVALLDGGVRIERDWLERLLEPLERDPSVQVVYGNYEPVLDTVFQTSAAIAYVDPKVNRNGADVRAPTVASLLLRKEVWEAVGGFPESLRAAEDLLFKDQLEVRGFHSLWAPKAVVYWELPTNFSALFHKFVNYSRFSLRAGLFRRWHRGVIRLYVALLVILFGAQLLFGNWVITGLLIPAFYLVRALKHLWRKREFINKPISVLIKLPLVGLIQLVIDLAMVIGVIEWAADRARGLPGTQRTGIETP